MNENTDQNIEILEYAVKLAKAVNEMSKDNPLVFALLGFEPEEISPLDYVTAARMVYADRQLSDVLAGLVEEVHKSDAPVHDAMPDDEPMPNTPDTAQVEEMRNRHANFSGPLVGVVDGTPYYRTGQIAEERLETSVSKFAGFWCTDCDAPHLLERK